MQLLTPCDIPLPAIFSTLVPIYGPFKHFLAMQAYRRLNDIPPSTPHGLRTSGSDLTPEGDRATERTRFDGSGPPLDAETVNFARRVFDAARAGETTELADLLAHGFPANLANEKGDTLLMLASYHGRVDLLRLLLAHGADPCRLNDRGQSPLAGAAFKGFSDVVEALVEGGAPVDHAGPDGRTALMVAAMFNRADPVTRLLALGAEPTRCDVMGYSAASIARDAGAVETFVLLEHSPSSATSPS